MLDVLDSSWFECSEQGGCQGGDRECIFGTTCKFFSISQTVFCRWLTLNPNY